MRVEYDRMTCAGWFQCVQEWDAFEMDVVAGKAKFEGSEKVEEDIFVRDVSGDLVEEAKAAAEACPVDAIKIYDDDGNQIVPSE